MASSAIPFMFSAIKIANEYYGDGSMRQIAPLSPAVHLGANKILVVGIRKKLGAPDINRAQVVYPTMAEIAGNILDSIFLDSLDADLERLERINNTISLIPDRRLEQEGVTLRPLDVLTISPSKSIDKIAGRYVHLLPKPLKFLLKGVGALGGHGSTLVSYLLFEKQFCRELMALGFKDAMAAQEDIKNFLELEERAQDETTG